MLRTIFNGSICLVGAIIVFGSTAMADPRSAQETPWFVGINYLDQNFGDLEGRDVDGDGFVISGGYQINQRLALELSYTEAEVDEFSVGGVSFPDEEVDFLSFSLTYDFDDWEDAIPYVRIGFANNTENTDANGHRVEISGRGFFGGLGLLYTVSPKVAVRIEYQQADSQSNNWSIGPKFSF